MQQSRREAQLSRLRFEEERLKVRDSLDNVVGSLNLKASIIIIQSVLSLCQDVKHSTLKISHYLMIWVVERDL